MKNFADLSIILRMSYLIFLYTHPQALVIHL
jgi:hypothetical protein